MGNLRRTLQDERGITLIVAIGLLFVLSVVGASVVQYTSAGARSAAYSQSDSKAYHMAEAGAAQALSILNNASNPYTASLLPSTTVAMDGGSATFSGTLSGDVWTIQATGATPNPSGSPAEISESVTVMAEVKGIVPGASPEFWNRFYHADPSTCLTIEDVTIPASVAAAGDICLEGTAKIRGSTTTVEAGDDVYLESSASIGENGQPIAEAHVVDGCKWSWNAKHSPCGPVDRVYANTVTTNPLHLTRPSLDLPYWYENAKPGPKHNCTSGSYPNGFDNDSLYNNSRPGGTQTDPFGRRYAEVTPTDLSYTCKYVEDGELVGEISWDHVKHVLTIHGSVFIDGDVRFDNDGQLVNYQGRGIIFAAGDVEFDEVVCAGGDGTFNCYIDPYMSQWDPDENMLIILSGGSSEYDQGKTSPRQPAALQGVLYAEDECVIHQDFKLSGPVICDQIQFPFDETWPTVWEWPPLGNLIDAQVYGFAHTATEFEVTVLAQYG